MNILYILLVLQVMEENHQLETVLKLYLLKFLNHLALLVCNIELYITTTIKHLDSYI